MTNPEGTATPVDAVTTPPGTAAPVDLATVSVAPPVAVSASGSTWYRHTQSTPATVWTVSHDLGRRPPAVAVFNETYDVQWDEFAIQHVDSNTLLITTDVAISGIALVE